MEIQKTRAPNPYMRFLAENRQKFKSELLAQAPDLKGKSLAMATAIYAGKIWKTLTKHEQDQYRQNLRFDNKYKVWINDKLGLYYEDCLGKTYGGHTKMLEDVIW